MLADKELQLLTAFVDGEMTRRQRKAVLRLLHKSSEARAFLRDLQENSHKLQQTAYHKLEANFAAQVMGQIAQRGIKPQAQPAQQTPRRRLSKWVGWAVAATILGILVGGYLAFSNRQPQQGPPIIVLPKKDPTPEPWEVRLAFQDLHQAPRKEKIQKEIAKAPAVHLDVTVGNNARAVERLTEVFKDNGIRLVVDQGARAQLKKNQPKTTYFIFAENVRPEELVVMLEKLSGDDTRGKTTQKSTFESMVVTALTSDDQQELTKLLGVDLSKPGSQDPSLFDIKAIDGSNDSKVVEEKGKKKSTQPTLPSTNRMAMVLAHSGDRSGPLTGEVKSFLANRREQRPGTMQVLLIVHQA